LMTLVGSHGSTPSKTSIKSTVLLLNKKILNVKSD
jgi:hypothetical protein